MFLNRKATMVDAENALPGRSESMQVVNRHYVTGEPIQAPFSPDLRQALVGMGCFWGAERRFWQLDGVHSTAVGYAGGYTPNPLYDEVCSGRTGHSEVVLIIYDPEIIQYKQLLNTFWESHDPTQGMQQGNDIGTQYRSGIYYFDEQQKKSAIHSRDVFQTALNQAGLGKITTEILQAPEFYYAEDYHQQYLAKNPGGYCGLGGTGVRCQA